MNQLVITAPVEGELVISKETFLSGRTLPGRTVTLDNGASAVAAADGTFSIPVTVETAFNAVTVSDGVNTIVRRFVCDLDPRKRYNFFIDDNVFFLTELVRKQHKSIFDSFHLANLRRLHKEYGMKVTLNTFFHNAHDPAGFTTAELDERYKSEFADNADWLRLAFHAYSEFPDAPYSKAHPEKLPEHHRLLKSEICRYAGEQSYIEPVLMHFYHISSAESRKFIADAGMNCYTLPTRDWEKRFADAGRKYPAQYNYEFNQLELQLVTMANFSHPDELEKCMEAAYAADERRFLLVGDHEQYAYPFYSNYQPDHLERMETMIRSLAEHGYESTYFTETLLK